MITIVGKDPTAVKRTTHKRCGAILEYTENEVRELWRGQDYGGGSDGADGFICPNCNEQVIIRRW